MAGELVTYDEIDLSSSRSVSVSGTEGELSPSRLGRKRRMQIVITPITAGVTIYVSKGDDAAAANKGIVLTANQSFVEADDQGFRSYQGQYRVVASGAGTVSVIEVFAK